MGRHWCFEFHRGKQWPECAQPICVCGKIRKHLDDCDNHSGGTANCPPKVSNEKAQPAHLTYRRSAGMVAMGTGHTRDKRERTIGKWCWQVWLGSVQIFLARVCHERHDCFCLYHLEEL